MDKKNPATDPEARSKLQTFATELRKLQIATGPAETRKMTTTQLSNLQDLGIKQPSRISVSPASLALARLAPEIAAKIERFLTGETKSLDEAFGLIPKRGRPENAKARKAIAREVFALRLARWSWMKIADDFSRRGAHVTDIRTLQEYYDEFQVELMQEEIDRLGLNLNRPDNGE